MHLPAQHFVQGSLHFEASPTLLFEYEPQNSTEPDSLLRNVLELLSRGSSEKLGYRTTMRSWYAFWEAADLKVRDAAFKYRFLQAAY